MAVASSRPDYIPTLSAANTSKLSMLVEHHILAIDEGADNNNNQQSRYFNSVVSMLGILTCSRISTFVTKSLQPILRMVLIQY